MDENTQKTLDELKTRYLPPKAAGCFIGVAPQTLARWRGKGGRGPQFIRVSGRKIMYALEDLNAWMNARRVSSTSEAAKST